MVCREDCARLEGSIVNLCSMSEGPGRLPGLAGAPEGVGDVPFLARCWRRTATDLPAGGSNASHSRPTQQLAKHLNRNRGPLGTIRRHKREKLTAFTND
eukprot:4086539-Amphidinium_carterae.1